MVKYEVEWSIEARLDLLDILDFYYQRNGNASYSRKLNSKINKSIQLIIKNPTIGLQTDIDTVKALVNGDYQIIYEIIKTTILIVMIWDCRRNPEDKIITSRTKE
ncbi:MAG: type II toxin-antitoxin system RelE/ParE family toxin [Bacteroidia bacterium]|nr:type II toxin-antitoxin system RelE/ParE family toxin [Bacteroidia bacterium]